MKRKRFSEEQMTKSLGLHYAVAKPADQCNGRGVSEATLHIGHSLNGGLQMSEAKRLRLLDEENAGGRCC